MRKALVVGIDYYSDIASLNGCVKDACAVESVLSRNADGSINFEAKLMVATSTDSTISKIQLENAIEDLYDGNSEVALLYFSGHGFTNEKGGFLVTSDCIKGDYGVRMEDITRIINSSKCKNKLVILDCCHAGSIATSHYFNKLSEIGEGVTILSACKKGQYAIETQLGGIFTGLFVDAMNGGASNILGQVSPGSVYAHIDQSLGAWEQRPVFKTNVESFVCLRSVLPSISIPSLRKITELFKNPGECHELDSTYEYTCENSLDENIKKFKILQQMERVGLVVPVGEEHMYDAAINDKSCKLTALGIHYWRLVNKNRI